MVGEHVHVVLKCGFVAVKCGLVVNVTELQTISLLQPVFFTAVVYLFLRPHEGSELS